MPRKSSVRQSAKSARASRKRPRRATRNGKLGKLDAQKLRALQELQRNVKKYSPMIRKKLRAAGKKIDPALVYVTAMYYPALDRLAKE